MEMFDIERFCKYNRDFYGADDPDNKLKNIIVIKNKEESLELKKMLEENGITMSNNHVGYVRLIYDKKNKNVTSNNGDRVTYKNCNIFGFEEVPFCFQLNSEGIYESLMID